MPPPSATGDVKSRRRLGLGLIALGVLFYVLGAPTRAKQVEVPLADPTLTASAT